MLSNGRKPLPKKLTQKDQDPKPQLIIIRLPYIIQTYERSGVLEWKPQGYTSWYYTTLDRIAPASMHNAMEKKWLPIMEEKRVALLVEATYDRVMKIMTIHRVIETR